MRKSLIAEVFFPTSRFVGRQGGVYEEGGTHRCVDLARGWASVSYGGGGCAGITAWQ